jgi:hypothetical protein
MNPPKSLKMNAIGKLKSNFLLRICVMSSVEFHEDEWGRQWSYSPALHGTQVRVSYPLFATLLQGVQSLIARTSERYARHQAELFTLAKASRLHDAYSDDDVLPVLYTPHEGVRDEFGRPVG